ncbi:MAG: hypothetical protein ACFFKA_13375, partial [Candidatus Thorarchaeota archaeon]
FYPCNWYSNEIEINSPSDIYFVKGDTGHYIQWTISAQYLSNPTYNISVNGVLNVSDSWQSNVPVDINLDSLSPGIYTYQIIAKNGDVLIEDIVLVTVEDLELTINHPEDINFTKGTTGINISWVITTNLELDPSYNITVNDVFLDSKMWHSGIPIIVNLDSRSVGTYEYRIEVFNGDLSVEDIVIVKVNAKPQEDGLIIILITAGVAGGIGAAVIIAIYFTRRRSK